MASVIHILLADPHVMDRQALSLLLSNDNRFRIVGESGSQEKLLGAVNEVMPDVVLLDHGLAALPGYDLIKAILRISPMSRIILLGAKFHPDKIRDGMRSGALGCVCKSAAYSELAEAIEAVNREENYLCRKSEALIINRYINTSTAWLAKYEKLTRREKEVFALLASGFDGKEVAGKLKISIKTFHKHKENLMEKLEVKNLAKLIRMAIKIGIAENVN